MKLPPDIGLPTDAWYRLPLAAALERIAERAELAEISSADDHSLLAAANRRAALASGLLLTVHGPYDDLEPGSPRESDRRRAVQVHRQHLEAAAEIGALTYVVHPDYSGCALPRDPRVVAALQRTFAELEELQRELGVRIVVENTPGVGLILDMDLAAICRTRHDILSEPHAELAHVHLHDDRGLADAGDPHLSLSRGIADAGAVVLKARESGARVILELLDEAAIAESAAHPEQRGSLRPS